MSLPQPLLDALRTAEHVLVLTGAGASAESGVPTFRQAQTGLWAQYDPEDLATPQAFDRNPTLVWNWYAWRRSLVSEAEPNAGHVALAAWEAILPNLTLVTQNVDSLHQRAGSRAVIELHGNISRIKCRQCEQLIPDWERLDGEPPDCPTCDGLLRPDVVWFGESLSPDSLGPAIEAAQRCDLFFSIGTSSLVYPAAALVEFALLRQAPVIEINPDETPLTRYADYVFQVPAGEALPVLTEEMLKLRG